MAKAKANSGTADPMQAFAQGLIDAQVRDETDSDLDALLNSASKAEQRVLSRKPPYTAEAMVQLFIDHPEYTHAQYAEHFGYRPSWFAGVLISNNLQASLDKRREEVAIVNPAMAGTMTEMFQAVTVQAIGVLQTRMDDPKVTNDLLLDVAKLGVSALGMGKANGPGVAPPAPPKTIHDLASNLLAAVPVAHSDTPAPDHTIEVTLREIPEAKAEDDDAAAPEAAA